MCCWPSHPSLGRIMAWGARHGAASATSASVRSHSSAWWSVATRSWCLGPCSPVTARYSLSRALRTSSGGSGGVRSRSHGSAPGSGLPTASGRSLRSGQGLYSELHSHASIRVHGLATRDGEDVPSGAAYRHPAP